MCGIVGFFYQQPECLAEQSLIQAMTDSLHHRGPDHGNFYLDRNLALGHRRLAIIDLSDSANQPIGNEDGTVQIVFNGEMYNFQELRRELVFKGHQFKSRTDSEVIVHGYEEWGTACFERFDGMLAVAIYDRRRQKLIIAKDRFGKKPLYYTLQNGVFAFASEIKALARHPDIKTAISDLEIERYLAYEYCPTPGTIYKNIHKLVAASFLEIPLDSLDDNLLQPQKYWQLDFTPKLELSEQDAAGQFRELLIRSVEKRLISDVPLGVFLSGGIDSSAIVWALTQVREAASIKTFSIGFREQSFDESCYARQVAAFFGTDHHNKTFDIAELLRVLPEVTDLLDEPFADASILPTFLLSKFTREQVTVALGGDGGDELFAGYDPFLALQFAPLIEYLPAALQRTLLWLVDRLPASDKNMSIGFRLHHFLKGFSPETKGRPELRNQVWLGARSLHYDTGINNHTHTIKDIYSSTLAQIRTDLHTVDRLSNSYISTYLHDDILVKVDRASMMNSLEVRTPFLDTELVEFVARLTVNYKLRGLETKYLMKRALQGYLPDLVLNRPKKGFGIPLAKWLRTILAESAYYSLDNLALILPGIFDRSEMNGLVNRHQAGRADYRKEIWSRMMLEKVCLRD
ncbi:MAG: asparagine synthase (glutamine-hydrolyzing) [Candidatus Neomarinimicrobiota bacterium]